jgi:hypothetical protein
MATDPIVEEVRNIRDAYARKFNYDLEAIFRDLKEQEKRSGRNFIRFPARPAAPAQSGGKGPIAKK